MKHLALITLLFCGGFVFSQNEPSSEREKKYQRYENGELVEDKYYLERDGERRAGQDFKMPEMDLKMKDMEKRMQSIQHGFTSRMSLFQNDLDERMRSIQLRSEQMQLKMKQRMDQMMQGMNFNSTISNSPEQLNAPTSFDFPIFGA